jgi:hypothetical protein
MKKFSLAVLIITTFTGWVVGQETSIPLDHPDIRDYERLSILYGGNSKGHLSIKNVRRNDIYEEALRQIISDTTLSTAWYPILNRQDDYIALEDSVSQQLVRTITPTRKNGLWNTFFTNPNYLFSLNTKPFYLRLNPILHFGYGRSSNGAVFSNQRGMYVRGGIDQKIFFQADVLESQRLFPEYINEFTRQFNAIPGNGFFKGYNSDVFGIKGGRDYNNSSGSVAWRFSPHISGTLGYGKNFIGDGYRSLIISDFSNNYFYGRIDTRVWKLHYTNLWGQLTTGTNRDVPGDNLIPKKWFAHHYLSLQISPAIRLGVFETIVFGRANGNFDINYLIPVVFYRTIEGNLGSPDNAMLGADFRWDILNRFSLYGQLSFDELKVSELIAGDGWWANKYGLQLGVKYFDAFGIKHLTGQIEANAVRPFTFTHKDSLRSYTHYNMPMAHPLGANFLEFLTRWQFDDPGPWNVEAALFWMLQGVSEDENVGSDITQSYESRTRDYGFDLPEGSRQHTLLARTQLSYEFYPGLNAYFRLLYRHQWRNAAPYTSDFIGQIGISYHFNYPNYDF